MAEAEKDTQRICHARVQGISYACKLTAQSRLLENVFLQNKGLIKPIISSLREPFITIRFTTKKKTQPNSGCSRHNKTLR